MQNIVFLGIFNKIANWIMSGISKVFTWLVSNIIAPVCSFIWQNALKYVAAMITEIISAFLYKVYALVLSILYALETAVYSFAGAKDVNFGGESDNILWLIFNQPPVEMAFRYITAIAVVLLFIFTTITVIKTTLDFGYDGKRNMGTIMSSFITSAITFLIIPAFCYGLIELTSTCMKSLYEATAAGNTSSLTDNIFLLSIRANVRNDSITDPNGVVEYIRNQDLNDLIKKMSENEMFWYKLDNVLPYIHRAANVDFIIGILGALIIAVNLIIMCGMFAQRVVEIITLYIVSPLFVASMPLDDGERFAKWRRTFIGRLCMGVGMIVALNIVMMLLSVIISGSSGYTISFTEDVAITADTAKSISDNSVDIILKLLFMIGSILSVKNLGSAITGIIDESAGAAEKESYETNKNRLKKAAQKVVGIAAGAGKMPGGAATGASAANQMGIQNLAGGSHMRGFQGQIASRCEQAFYDSIKSQNRTNSAKALFTRRGSKDSALNNQMGKGNNAVSTLRQLKTYEEGAKFMGDFENNGGVNSFIATETTQTAIPPKSDTAETAPQNTESERRAESGNIVEGIKADSAQRAKRRRKRANSFSEGTNSKSSFANINNKSGGGKN